MKRKLIMITLAAALAGSLLSCGSRGADGFAKDSADSEEVALGGTAEGDNGVRMMLISQGLGPVRVGESLDSLPDSVPGLYDSAMLQEGEDCRTLIFARSTDRGLTMYPFSVLDFGDNRVDVILLNDDQCGVQTPEGKVITLSTPFKNVLTLPEVSARWEEVEGSGAWYWTWEGLWFQPSLDNPGDSLGARLFDGRSAPVADDFTDEVTIGYIGTGLPF